jgi:hypothetical protein
MDNSVPYTLIGPDGTRCVFNDSADAAFVGYLDPSNGITGLLDTAQVLTSSVNRVEADGATQGNNYFNNRTGIIQGIVIPDPNMATYNMRESLIKRASRGMSALAPSVLQWTPSGYPPRQIDLWRQGLVAFTGRRPKNFVIPMMTADPFTYSQALNSQIIVPGGTSGESGFVSPMTNPIESPFDSSVSNGIVTNQGDTYTWWLATIAGPCSNPTLINETNSNGLVSLATELSANQQLIVDSRLKIVTLQTPNATGAPYNLIANPNFEYDAALGSPAWWSASTVNATFATGEFAVVTSLPIDRQKSLFLSGEITAANGTAGALSPTGTSGFPVIAGASYTLSFDIAPFGLTPPVVVYAALKWYNSSGTLLATTTSASISNVGFSVGQSERYGLGNCVAPAGAVYGAVYLYASTTASGTNSFFFSLDNIQVTESTTVLPYFDGDIMGYQWLGTPGDSTSAFVTSYSYTNLYGAYAQNFDINTWWSLLPGANIISLGSSSYSAGAQCTIQWRDAWE